MVQSNQDASGLVSGQAGPTDAATGNPNRAAGEAPPLNIAEVFRDLPVGSRVKMRQGVVAEVTANPNDGGWLFIKYLEHPQDPSKVGQEDMVFCVDVVGVA
jgi:hypothetical protein